MMAERLHITGRGADRAAALADADEQAQTYYGDQPHIREIGAAYCDTTDLRNIAGEGRTLCTFNVEVVYRGADERIE